MRRFTTLTLLLWYEGVGSRIVEKKRHHHDQDKLRQDDVDWKALGKLGWLKMRSELKRSLIDLSINSVNTAEIEEVVLHMLKRRDAFVFIVNNKILVSRAFLDRGVKYYRHAVMIRTALDRLSAGVPNVIYQFEGGASGTSNRYECGATAIQDGDDSAGIGHLTRDRDDKMYYRRFHKAVPRLCIAKREGYQKCGLLTPNPYIGNGNLTDWERTVSGLQALAAKIPFEARDPKLFWRGHIQGALDALDPNDCGSQRGQHARLSAASLTLKRPNLFDIRCVHCKPRNNTKYPCDRYSYDDDLNNALNNLNAIKGDYTAHDSFLKYKHIINLPGSTTGSYSRNLNTLWALGSIVFLWQSPHVEWYYPALVDGVTHLTVNKSNAIAVVEMLSLNPGLSRRLRRGAKFVAETFLCPDCLVTYLKDTIRAYVDTFHLGEILNDRGRLLSFFNSRAFNCSQLELVEFFNIDDGHGRYCTFRDLTGLSCSELLEYAFYHHDEFDYQKSESIKSSLVLPPIQTIEVSKTHQHKT